MMTRDLGVRFDDGLATVLLADVTTPLGRQSAWRQLVDLIGRGRAPADDAALTRLAQLRPQVPQAVRAASARGLAFARPPLALIRFFAADEFPVAAPVLRTAMLSADEWIALLPSLSAQTRSVLRHRRDLGGAVERALAAFGPADFVLPGSEATSQPAAAEGPRHDPLPAGDDAVPLTGERLILDQTFRSVGAVTRELPALSEALRDAPEPAVDAPSGPFKIAELVARIEAFRRQRGPAALAAQDGATANDAAPGEAEARQRPDGFRFETDDAGIVRWVSGVTRAPLIGLSLDMGAMPNGSRVDGVAAGAFRRRAAFSDARLVVEGVSDAAGSWRISGVPAFDDGSGRFIGYRGTARRPRSDESTEPAVPRTSPADSLRQLVHELRTPTNAIAGFAEMIESELLGVVPPVYRDRAQVIRSHAQALIEAIEDIDTAARIDARALDLRPTRVALHPLLLRIAEDLSPLANLRGTRLRIGQSAAGIELIGDDRAIERVFARLLAAVVATGSAGERIKLRAARDGATAVITLERPKSLPSFGDETLFAIDTDETDGISGMPLLGTGFALRLVRNLAVELGGSLMIGEDRLTLRLPAVEARDVEQVSIS